MQKRFLQIITTAAVILTLSLPTVAFANSSWHWVTMTNPSHLLLPLIIITLIVEITAIYRIPKAESLLRTVCAVTGANLLSFAMPFFFPWIGNLISPSIYLYDLQSTIEYTPFFIVGAAYLLTTLFVEVPVVYFALRRHVRQSTNRLLFAVIVSNTATTAIVALAEHIFCYGEW